MVVVRADNDELLGQLHARPWLLILDGLERILVAYHRIDAAEVPDEEANNPTDKIVNRNPCDAIRDEDNDLLRALAQAFQAQPAADLTAPLIEGLRALYLYAGEYDFTCPPELVRESAERIGGVTYETLEGLGHFPMSENYERFRPVLMRTLADIERRRNG